MDIICIGGINIDYFHPTKNSEAVPKSMAGGVAYNLSKNLTNLGHRVSLISAVGLDQEGLALITDMEKSGIDPQSILKLPDQKTATISFEITSSGVSSSQINTDIYDHLTAETLQPVLAGMHHVNTWIVDTDLSQKALEYIALNKPRNSLLYAVIADRTKAVRIRSALPYLEGLFLNQHEAVMLANQEINSNAQALHVADLIRVTGPRFVFLTLGENGVAVSTANEGKIYQAIIATYKNTIPFHGAGDAFASGVVEALMNKMPLETAIEQGLALAKSVNQTDREELSTRSRTNNASK